MNHFCTITTADYLFKTFAVFDSVRAIHSESFLHVLCIDPMPDRFPEDNIAFYALSDLRSQPIAQTIISKYSASKDKMRWSLKPVF
jgi:hypothetical protein